MCRHVLSFETKPSNFIIPEYRNTFLIVLPKQNYIPLIDWCSVFVLQPRVLHEVVARLNCILDVSPIEVSTSVADNDPGGYHFPIVRVPRPEANWSRHTPAAT